MMRCSEVQHQLADSEIAADGRDALAAHLRECPACRQAQVVYAQIDETLQRQPAWEPPPGFARRVVRQAEAERRRSRPARVFSIGDLLDAATTAALVVLAAYLTMPLVESLEPVLTALAMPTQPVMWTWVGLSYFAAAWIVRRSRA